MELLAHEGFDPAFGARPLKRVIQREIGDRAAVLILEGQVAEGSTIRRRAAAGDQVDGAGHQVRSVSVAAWIAGSCTTWGVSRPGSILQNVRTELTAG